MPFFLPKIQGENAIVFDVYIHPMLIIRPTASLAKRMKVKLEPSFVESTNTLGDWYAVDLVLNRKQFVLAVNSKSRLGLVLAAAPYVSFPERLLQRLQEVLNSYEVPKEKVETEIHSMNEFVLAKTLDKSILGSMNDYRKNLEYMASYGKLDVSDLLRLSLKISATPSLVMPGTWPQEVTLELFGQAPLKKLVRQPAPPAKPILYLVK